MKRLVLVSLLATVAIGLHAETYLDNARVRSVDPRYESVDVPRQECTSQWVNEPRRTGQRERDYGGAVIGGMAGALLGNQVDKAVMSDSSGPSLQVRVTVEPVAR